MAYGEVKLERLRNVVGFNGLKWKEMHNINLVYNKTIVDLCLGRHGDVIEQ